jgi:Ser/Thr protein kinase RdoA (MazF antagonist)
VGRRGRTSLFQDVIKSVWILDIVVVCNSVQKSSDMSGYNMTQIGRCLHLDGHPRF